MILKYEPSFRQSVEHFQTQLETSVAACSDKWDYTSPDYRADGSAISSTVNQT
jgi:hypothetical protein